MLVVTIGGHVSHYSSRGINGALDDVLWPIQHGILFYPGMHVLPPFVLHQTHALTEAMLNAGLGTGENGTRIHLSQPGDPEQRQFPSKR